MVYKKYIKKSGKVYGPYTYHSKRVDGKVVSEYLGRKRKPDYSKFIWFSVGFFLVIFLVYSSYNSLNFGPSGKSILDLETTYYEGEPLEGVLRLSIKEGELIPDSAKIVVETASGKVSEYSLSGLVAEDLVEGNFYVEGKDVSGEGRGYGVVGEKKIYPTVYFTLEVFTKAVSVEEIEEIEQEPETIPPTQPEQEPTEEVEEEIIPEEPVEEVPTEEKPSEGETEEETAEEIPEEKIEEEPVEEEVTEETEEEITGESVEEEVVEESEEAPESGPEESSPEAPAEEAPITGSFIFQIAGGFLDFFRGIIGRGTITTGRVALEIEQEIDGQVSRDSPFIYTLSEGKTASIKSGSIRTDSEELSDDVINLDIDGNNISVTTDYFEGEPGFGEDYLGDVSKQISIDLSELGVVAEKGKLKISLVYEEQELISLSTSLEVEGEEIKATSEEIEAEQNITEITGVIASLVLTEEEKEILINEFGNTSIKTTKAEVFNDRLIVRHELVEYWIEYSYDYASTDISEQIESQIQNDKIKWLKDLADVLAKSKEKKEVKGVGGLIGEFSIEAGEGVISEEEVALEEIPTGEETELLGKKL